MFLGWCRHASSICADHALSIDNLAVKAGYSTCSVRLDYCYAVLAGLLAFTLSPTLRGRCHFATWLCDSDLLSGTHTGVHFGRADTDCQNTSLIHTMHRIMRQPHHAVDLQMYWWQSFLCCCTDRSDTECGWHSFCSKLKTCLFESVYGHQEMDWRALWYIVGRAQYKCR